MDGWDWMDRQSLVIGLLGPLAVLITIFLLKSSQKSYIQHYFKIALTGGLGRQWFLSRRLRRSPLHHGVGWQSGAGWLGLSLIFCPIALWSEDMSWVRTPDLPWCTCCSWSFSLLILPSLGEQRRGLRQGRFHGNLCQDQALHGLDQEDYQQGRKMRPLENQSVEIWLNSWCTLLSKIIYWAFMNRTWDM